ncbi:MAG: hypothetical protein AAF337_15535 [Pseudomonadota bacterium]
MIDARTIRALLLPPNTLPDTAMAPATAKLAHLLGFDTFEAATQAILKARSDVFAALKTLLPPPSDPH